MPKGSIESTFDYVGQFGAETGASWPTMAAARNDAFAVQNMLFEALRQFTSGDVDVVVFGSLARREWTSGSDVDWTMLVDGQADSQHRVASREIQRCLGNLTYRGVKLNEPGAEGIFGNMAFSHEIVHHIGGQSDTNRNTTQRILLLLEAAALRDPGDDLAGPYGRIVRQVLNRYLRSDSNFHSQADNESRIPRFLLNDIVRYWRTMCVDFAYKDWEQGGKKWAIRNIKLRTSRKLLFVAGLLTVFSCYQNESLRRDRENPDDYLLKLQKHLLNFVYSTPLNILVWTLRGLGMDERCKEFLDIYEEFLSQMNDKVVRDHLGGLSEIAVYTDGAFLKCRGISHKLQAVLKSVCFEIDSPLREFTYEYGVF
ncbi:MAG: nucleotidyltransferase domain-containing protein [Pirellulaceae bacterium]